MFEMLQKFVLVSVTLFCSGVWFVLSHKVASSLKFYIKKIRGKKMIECAQEVGPVLYYNEVGKTTAVCLARDFQTKAIHLKLKPWELDEEVWVRPTFVFRGDNMRAGVHVRCTKHQAIEMSETLVTKLTGFRKDWVDKASFEKAQKILIVKEPRLFVPFSRELSEEEGERQLHFYGSTPPFDQIRQYLLGE